MFHCNYILLLLIILVGLWGLAGLTQVRQALVPLSFIPSPPLTSATNWTPAELQDNTQKFQYPGNVHFLFRICHQLSVIH